MFVLTEIETMYNQAIRSYSSLLIRLVLGWGVFLVRNVVYGELF